jgi:TonB-dependent receptor
LIGEHYFGGFDVNWILSHAYTKNDSPFDFYMRFYEYKSADSGMRDISDPDSLRLPGKNLISYAFNNFDRSAVERTYFYQNDNDDRNLVGSLDLTRNYRLSSALAGFLKVGYKFRGKTRHRNSSQWIGPYWLRTSLPNIMLEDGTIVPKDWSQTSWPGGYDGLIGDYLGGAPYLQRDIADDYLLYPLFNEDLVREWYNANRTGISTNGQQHEYVELLIGNRDRYRVEEQINAAYLMTKLNFGQFASIIAGVRYEDEHNTYKAKYVPRITGFLESQNGVITDTTTVFEKGEWLPNFHLRLKPMQWWDIRLAATRTLARPDFQMRLPALYVNNQDQEIQQRDPFLKNAKAWNYDASMSLYTSRYGLLTVSGFRKKVDDIFYWLNDIVVLTTALADSLGLPPEYGPYPQYSLDKPVNTDDSKVWGWEVDLQTNLSFLPGLFQNIVFNANYTKIESETTYPRFRLEQPPGFPPRPPVPVFYQTIREMEGQVDHIGNIAIGYDQGGFSGRLSVYFQGSYLDAISTFERLDQYRKSFQRWDISLKQQILRNVVLFMNINNLTNTVEGSRLRFNNLDMGGIRNGMTVDMGLRVTL